jgi:metal-responsive CopG/Arc/MetJ family transcriptional regulator
MEHAKPFSISLPPALLKRMDRERGDVTRSRFMMRIVEAYFMGKDNDKGSKKPDG